MKGRLIGIVILAVIVIAALAYYFFGRPDADRSGGGLLNRRLTTVTGYIGSEKSGFLDDPEVKEILEDRYGLMVDYRRAGSIEMIDLPRENMDFLWPSSQVALELYKLRGGASLASETVFTSPIVLYSWTDVAGALERAGLVTKGGQGQVEADIAGLLEQVLGGATWASVGLNELYGPMVITSSDPTRSNSGNLWAGLVANLAYGGVVGIDGLDQVIGDVKRVFAMQGYMEHSTGTLYEQYLTKGMGAYPLVVGYENQMVEFALQYPDIWKSVKDLMSVIYPVPTVYSEHPLIALTDGGKVLIEALQDPDVMSLAWTRHGFRTGIENDPAELGIPGIPRRVTQIIRMPVPAVMDRIVNELQ
jgi:hypothetical protein